MRCFWSSGYAATSLDDLLQASGMHRGSFYRTFGDKRGAFHAALGRYGELIATEDILPAIAGRGSASRRLVRLLHARLDTALGISAAAIGSRPGAEPNSPASATTGARPGCLVINTALELAPHQAATRTLVEESLGAVRSVIVLLVHGAIEEHDADPRLDVGLVSDQLFALLLGATVLAAAGEERRQLRRLLRDGVRNNLKPPATEGSIL